jgi:hypothetical protein
MSEVSCNSAGIRARVPENDPETDPETGELPRREA